MQDGGAGGGSREEKEDKFAIPSLINEKIVFLWSMKRFEMFQIVCSSQAREGRETLLLY